jgi:D-alanine-D-alanine ligase
VRIAVLAGGLSHERDVSLRSGRRVSDALRRRGLDVQSWDVDQTFLQRIQDHDADVAVIALHGGSGENGNVQSILELAALPHSGTASRQCRVAFDKAVAKSLLRTAGVSTAEWVVLPSTAFRDWGALAVSELILDSLGVPLVVKPATGGSALGVNLVHTAAELAPALVTAYSYGPDAVVERLIGGPELTVAVVEVDGEVVALPPVLIECDGPYDYQARYDASSGVRYSVLERDTDGVDVAALQDLAVQVHRVLELRDLSRMDVRYDDAGVPFVLEAAVAPGLTETSVWPIALAAAGMNLGEVFETLSRRALEGSPDERSR